MLITPSLHQQRDAATSQQDREVFWYRWQSRRSAMLRSGIRRSVRPHQPARRLGSSIAQVSTGHGELRRNRGRTIAAAGVSGTSPRRHGRPARGRRARHHPMPEHDVVAPRTGDGFRVSWKELVLDRCRSPSPRRSSSLLFDNNPPCSPASCSRLKVDTSLSPASGHRMPKRAVTVPPIWSRRQHMGRAAQSASSGTSGRRSRRAPSQHLVRAHQHQVVPSL